MGSFSQTLFFGEVKRQPEIRLRSQASINVDVYVIQGNLLPCSSFENERNQFSSVTKFWVDRNSVQSKSLSGGENLKNTEQSTGKTIKKENYTEKFRTI